MRRHAFHAGGLAATAAILSGSGASGGCGWGTNGDARGISSIIFSKRFGYDGTYSPVYGRRGSRQVPERQYHSGRSNAQGV